jgi:hypothetical protein
MSAPPSAGMPLLSTAPAEEATAQQLRYMATKQQQGACGRMRWCFTTERALLAHFTAAPAARAALGTEDDVRKHFVAIADADVSRNRRASALPLGAARPGRRCSRSCVDGTRARTTVTRSMTPSGTDALDRSRAAAPRRVMASDQRPCIAMGSAPASELERARMENTRACMFSVFNQRCQMSAGCV